MRQALDVLREYMLFSDNGGFIHKCLKEISALVENELSAKQRQADIRSFFQQKSRKQKVDYIIFLLEEAS